MPRVRLSLSAFGFVLTALVGSATADDDPKKPAIPKEAEKAVAAVKEAVPKAEVDAAEEPKGFGGSGGKGSPMFWVVVTKSFPSSRSLAS